MFKIDSLIAIANGDSKNLLTSIAQFTLSDLGKSPSPPRVVSELSSNFNHSSDSRPTKASSLQM